jgi:flagellar biosynthesis protein FlhB
VRQCVAACVPGGGFVPSAAAPFRVHLQWFAAEDEGRTEEPSEHKLRKAREEGKVAKSAEVTSSLLLLTGVATLGLLASHIMRVCIEMVTFFLSRAASPNAFAASAASAVMSYFLRLAVPLLAVLFVIAIGGNVLQVGLLFTVKPLTPDLGRVVPHVGRWLRRSLGSPEAAFNLAKSIVKIAVIAAVAYLNIRGEIPRITMLVMAPWYSGVVVISQIAFRILLEAAIALLAFSAVDYWFQRRQHRESLKMSRQEVKEERKMYEGDPLTRSRLRERMREIMRRTMLKAVPRADVVITNPTHFAVALEYNRATMPAPVVVAKGADVIAAKIRELASDNAVPIVENKPLARALYQEVEIGDAIPEKFYEAMSIILAEVWRVSGRREEMRASDARREEMRDSDARREEMRASDARRDEMRAAGARGEEAV